jgi:hypothetical protein
LKFRSANLEFASSSTPYRLFPIPTFLLAVLALSLTSLTACQKRADMRPLDKAGMDSPSIAALRALDTTDAEVAELVMVKNAGLADSFCIELVRAARSHAQAFAAGEDVATLHRIGLAEATILELARLNQFGLWTEEVRALRLAGATDAVILALTQRRAAGQPVLSSLALARLKNAGIADSTLLELARRGLTDDQAEQILRLSPRQRSHNELLRRFPAH